jgi:hypothetical protein
MTKVICLMLISIILFAGCSGIPYTTQEKAALGFYIASSFADFRTTELALDRGARECNPLLDDHPSDLELVTHQLSSLGFIYLLGEIWPDKRVFFYTISGAAHTIAAIHNDGVMR